MLDMLFDDPDRRNDAMKDAGATSAVVVVAAAAVVVGTHQRLKS
jgi:hypothetical protein